MTNPRRWVGIDLHRRRSQLAVIDEQGELTLCKRIPTGRETFTELLLDTGYDVHLAHPLRTRAIAAAR